MTMRRIPFLLAVLAVVVGVVSSPSAQTAVTPDRLLNAVKEPQNWLTYGGDYSSNRHSGLAQITPPTSRT
jgi:glucose dehydrogenase